MSGDENQTSRDFEEKKKKKALDDTYTDFATQKYIFDRKIIHK